jgi:hypothetical protein
MRGIAVAGSWMSDAERRSSRKKDSPSSGRYLGRANVKSWVSNDFSGESQGYFRGLK